MTVGKIARRLGLEIIAGESGAGRQVRGVFCCDLLSLAITRAGEDFAWITVMGNVNVIAVASLAEVACVVLAEGTQADPGTIDRANERGIPLLASHEPVFETASAVYRLRAGQD